MNKTRALPGVIALLILLTTSLGQTQAQGPGITPGPLGPLGTSFTYQGLLTQGETPYNGACDLRFTLYDSVSGGAQVGPVVDRLAVAVSKGLFTITDLDFGAGVFTGSALWLEVAARCPGGSGAYVILTPRQPVTAAPYSTYSQQTPWSGIAGMPAGFADNVDNDTIYSAGTGLLLSGTILFPDTAYLQRRVQPCGAGYAIQSVNEDGSVVCRVVDNTTYGAGTGLILSGTTFFPDTTYLQRRVAACGAGYAIQSVAEDGSVVCEVDDDTVYDAGAGLLLSGTTFLADPTAVQLRVTEACTASSSIRQVNQDGTVVCEPDADTLYSASTGLLLTGTAFSADTTYLQRRVGACGAGYAIQSVNPDGSVVCQAVDNTNYQAGTGLYLAGTIFGITTTYRLPQGCTNTQIAKWNGTAWACSSDAGVTDHGALTGLGDDDHPQYFALAQNETVAGIPAFDGGTSGATAPFTVDSTFLVAGLNADQLDSLHAADFASASHTHWGQSWTGSGTGLALSGGSIGLSGSGSTYGVSGATAATAGYGVYGSASAASGANAGVYGVSASTAGYGIYGSASAASGTTYGVYGTVTSPNGWAGYFASAAGNGVYITAPAGKVGLNVASGLAQVAGNTIWHAGNDGAGSGLDSDTLDGLHAADFAGSGHNHDHGTLTGLGDDDHPQYFALAQNETVTGIPAFNGGTSGATAPFSVDSTFAVTNLNTDLLDGYHASYFQARVSGVCSVGSTIRAVNADGTVVCQVDSPTNRPDEPAARDSTTVSSGNDIGYQSSATIGVDGLPIISYNDETAEDLVVVHCSNLACTSYASTIVDSSTANTGEYTSIIIGTDGYPLISYYDRTNGDLRVAHCTSVDCSTSATYTLDGSNSDVGEYSSITIGGDGLGLISYFDRTNTALKVARCSNTACSAATVTTVDNDGDRGYYSSITTGVDGFGLISYFDEADDNMVVTHCENANCTADTQAWVDTTGQVGYLSSITIGADGLGLISYWRYEFGQLKVAHCTNLACTANNNYILDDGGGFDNRMRGTSITIGADGLGIIAYYDWNDLPNLRTAHCRDLACSTADLVTLRSSVTDVGVNLWAGITIGVDGYPLIPYYYANSGDLGLVHCSSAFCTNNFRRR